MILKVGSIEKLKVIKVIKIIKIMIVLNQKQKRVVLILGVVAVLLLAMVAIITAIRLQQVGTEPVAPSVPKSKPKAEEVIPTPGPGSACKKTFQIAQGPTLTPTPTGIITPTPTGTLTPTPTSTPGPTATGTPGPTATGTPGPTTTPVVQGPTAIPTVPQQSLPQAGGILPTIGAAVGGLGIILLGLLLLL